MIRIALSGCNGRMGRYITDICAQKKDLQIVAGFDQDTTQQAGYPVYDTPAAFTGPCDVIIDFSNVSLTDALLAHCVHTHTPLVLCTTGHSAAQLASIDDAAHTIPLFRSGNMTLGINLMLELLQKCARVLGDDFDVEIIEKHHNQKVDAPSGTALMLADAVAQALPHPSEYTYDRHTRREKRGANEIGISAIRGGTIVGEHTVMFCGRDEVIELTHIAHSREVFAVGAVNAARFLANVQTAGLYSMKDVVESI